MAGPTARIPGNCRNINSGDREVEWFGGRPSFPVPDVFFGFLEEGDGSPEICSDKGDGYNQDGAGFLVDEDEEEESSSNAEESKAFWEKQHQLLQATLCRTSSLESKIRQATKEAITECQLAGNICICRKPVAGGCRRCLQREVSDHLLKAGYNSAICKSKWRSSLDIPSGEHTYLDVVENNPKKGDVRVVIELNFRGEFEVARASEEYNRLIKRLPEVFVGKAERLRTLIKILCSAAKKCMKENKMHMAPWRKHKYMQAKWFGTCERTTHAPLFPVGYSDRPTRPKASMLTFDLLEKLPSLHCTAVEVV
ncbi:PREDICTED: uncharacterized protein LOC104599397 [Nelumbo nucifera]|uniref:Uncharacterized protein LOC104599397 n=2 Tax=Nelumbo nucifera TaxID=4432 RepID=A0A1U8A1Y2_NELNU|nr:PREDICTED: uncharacterized protein LOC104599397 [Nelumbo nucifera]DAD22869.1 TPA_asm: hypothetical protein HUJ06_024332 [Nelumbo nucifera]